MNLPQYSWNEATILGLATARGFTALGIAPTTIRQWAHRGHITAIGKAPGGAYLYPIDQVARHATKTTIGSTVNA